MSQNLALIPARGGSKGVPGKNIKLLGGHPLISFSVVAALNCPQITKVLVSTDDDTIASISKKYGAEVPFRRPAEISTDQSTDLEYFLHALDWLRSEQKWIPDLIVLLRPTTPLRDPKKISVALEAIKADTAATSLRSAHQLSEPPQKMLQIINNRFAGFFPDDQRPEYFNLPRQRFPAAYQPNGYVDICRAALVKKTTQLYGPAILPFVTEWSAEIDSAEDLDFLDWQLSRRKHPLVDMVDSAKQTQSRN